MPDTHASQLEAANARLYALRANFAADKEQRKLLATPQVETNAAAQAKPDKTPLVNALLTTPATPATAAALAISPPTEPASALPAGSNSIAHPSQALPSHLGWGSVAVTTHLRRQQDADTRISSPINAPIGVEQSQTSAQTAALHLPVQRTNEQVPVGQAVIDPSSAAPTAIDSLPSVQTAVGQIPVSQATIDPSSAAPTATDSLPSVPTAVGSCPVEQAAIDPSPTVPTATDSLPSVPTAVGQHPVGQTVIDPSSAVSTATDSLPSVPTAVGQHPVGQTAINPSSAASTATDSLPSVPTAVGQHPARQAVIDSPLDTPPAPAFTPPATIKLYPDIALALLRQERVADGRLWFLLRALDENGRGVWTRRMAYDKLTRIDAPYYLCGERQLRKLLERGEGLFWHQDEEKRIWLHGQARVADALEIGRFRLKPIALPLPILYQSIGEVRAHFYASFHSTRSGGDKPALPISRQQLAAVSGASPRTQQTYENRAVVEATTCIAVGREITAVDPQEEAWENGRASFPLTDHLGQQGERGKVYQARRIPNSYSGPHAASGHGCRRLNRQLIDLRQKGAGNGQWIQSDGKRPLVGKQSMDGKQSVNRRQSVGGRQSIDSWQAVDDRLSMAGEQLVDGSAWTRRYAANGGEGGEAWSKANGRHLIYWRGRTGKRGITIWYIIPSVKS